VAHALQEKEKYYIARAISQFARSATGIEIHPAAKIGKCLFIDHGSCVVIGETAIIGDNCTIYQGVTLGGTGKNIGKRHPTIGNNVMIGAGAKVLGPIIIGDNSKIAAGAVVLKDVPSDSTAVGIPARIVTRSDKEQKNEFDQIHIPDPINQELTALKIRLTALEEMLNK
ncbi:MAG: serine O-acetyltransferase EpsC, partial [Clostridia bacterium]